MIISDRNIFFPEVKLFTEIYESRNEWVEINPAEYGEFMKKAEADKGLSKEYMTLLKYLDDCKIYSGIDLDKILNGTGTEVKSMAAKYGCTLGMIGDIQKLAKKSKSDTKGLPQFMTPRDFESVLSGKRQPSDFTLDLETERGRDRCTRTYAPLVTAIAHKYRGSGLEWNGLISAGYMGLTKAMNDYHKPDEYVDIESGLDGEEKKEVKKQKGLTFRQYAGWRIRQQILNDINELSRTVRITQYEYEKNKAAGNAKGNFNTVSIDKSLDDEGATMIDRMAELANDPDAFKPSARTKWEKLYKIIDGKFPTRTATIFYKYFGLNGYEQQRGVEIAKEMGVSGARISICIKEVMTFLKTNKDTRDILGDLLELYTESLIIDNTPDTIMDAMITDDILIMLKESTQWNNSKEFNNAMGAALETFSDGDRDRIIECLEKDVDFIDDIYDSNKSLMVNFLESVYPALYIRRKSDTEILNMMFELNESFKVHNGNK